MPPAILIALVGVAAVYVLTAVVAVAAQPAERFEGQEAGLAAILQDVTGSTWPGTVLAAGAIVSIFSVTLVVLYGQTRILFAMSRDGLVPPIFHRVNPRTVTPVHNTVIVASVVALLAGLIPIDFLAEMTGIGTLVAFLVVSIGVIVLRQTAPDLPRGFRVPGYPVTPILSVGGCLWIIVGCARSPSWRSLCGWVPRPWLPGPAKVDAEYQAFVAEYARDSLDRARRALPEDVTAAFEVVPARSTSSGLIEMAERAFPPLAARTPARRPSTGRPAPPGDHRRAGPDRPRPPRWNGVAVRCGGGGAMGVSLEAWLGVGAAVVLVSVVAVRASVRLGLPSLLLYLGIGVLLGESVLGVQFENAPLTESLGLAALVLILTEGGLTTRWADVRPALGLGISLSTVAVAVSILVCGAALHLLLGLDWRTAFLWGAVLSSTDAAAVFSVLRGVGVRKRVSGALELESGMNDAPVVIAVVLLATPGPLAWWSPALVVYELVVGGLIGAALGLGGAWALRRAALPATGLYPLAALSVCVLGYASGQAVHASGFLATYVAALILGNSRLPHRGGVLSFAEGTGWLAQIGLFVLLGLYASPSALGGALLPALIAGVVLLLLARPLSVVVAAVPFRVPWREQAFLSWAGLRGAVPIVLALIPVTRDPASTSATLLVDVVLVLVVALTLLQGTTLPWVARRLGVSRAGEPTEVEVDAAPLDELSADLLQVRVPVGSKLRGVYLRELRLPQGASVSLVVRDGTGFTPGPDTRLRERDQLLVVTTADARTRAEQRIRAVDRAGRLARWRGETGHA